MTLLKSISACCKGAGAVSSVPLVLTGSIWLAVSIGLAGCGAGVCFGSSGTERGS